MNTARIVVLGIALVAGGLAAYLASGSDPKPVPAEQPAQIATVEVLVARSDIPLGAPVNRDVVQWQNWPSASASSNFITRASKPNADSELDGALARQPFVTGEPIREAKLVRPKDSGFMAAILPTGLRAVSTEISPETGAGGFILPNDRVDVILSKREKNPDRAMSTDTVVSEVILSNIRVLAIDQAPKEKDGQNNVVGKTATLELKPEQAETLARSRQSGTLSLALRSLADANAPEPVREEGDRNNKRDSVNVVRYGVPTMTTMQK